jgi:hypothetical protein
MPRPDDPGQSEDAHTAPGKSEDAPGQQPDAETKPIDPSEEVVIDAELPGGERLRDTADTAEPKG